MAESPSSDRTSSPAVRINDGAFVETLLLELIVTDPSIEEFEENGVSFNYDQSLEFTHKGTSLRSLKGIIGSELETLKFLNSLQVNRQGPTPTKTVRLDNGGDDGSTVDEAKYLSDLAAEFKAQIDFERFFELRSTEVTDAVTEFRHITTEQNRGNESSRIKELSKLNEKLVNLVSRTLCNGPPRSMPKRLIQDAEQFLRDSTKRSLRR